MKSWLEPCKVRLKFQGSNVRPNTQPPILVSRTTTPTSELPHWAQPCTAPIGWAASPTASHARWDRAQAKGRDSVDPSTHSLVLRLDSALASSQQRGISLVLDTFINGGGLAAKAADRSAETTRQNPEPSSSRRYPRYCRHCCSAGECRTEAPEYACA